MLSETNQNTAALMKQNGISRRAGLHCDMHQRGMKLQIASSPRVRKWQIISISKIYGSIFEAYTSAAVVRILALTRAFEELGICLKFCVTPPSISYDFDLSDNFPGSLENQIFEWESSGFSREPSKTNSDIVRLQQSVQRATLVVVKITEEELF